ncbi:SHC-transforming protein 2-like [Corvus kubaryi]|uniref:SHC-transforming protein 2-like n=1 Tax=Corvus kubaryi TaxID=68294 RepID=UPI001C03D85B|nr:SHC-transforming protein 2-like [Corvus kubaryi]
MLPEPKYDRFRDEPLTAPMPSPAPAPCPAAGEEPEHGTTFCALLPRMPQWKFPGSSGFLGRGPAGAARDAPAAAESPSGLAAVLGACEPLWLAAPR